MKKTVKKLMAFFLVVMIICSTLSFGASAAKEEKVVAKVSVICLVKSPGHVWIYVENLTNKQHVLAENSSIFQCSDIEMLQNFSPMQCSKNR